MGGSRAGRAGLSTQNRGAQPSPVAASRVTATNRCPRCSNHLPVSDSEDKTFFCPVCSLWVPTTARGDGGRDTEMHIKKVRLMALSGVHASNVITWRMAQEIGAVVGSTEFRSEVPNNCLIWIPGASSCLCCTRSIIRVQTTTIQASPLRPPCRRTAVRASRRSTPTPRRRCMGGPQGGGRSQGQRCPSDC